MIAGELTDAAAVRRAVHGADAVISALGPSLDRKATGMPLIDGTRTMLDAMRGEGVERYIGIATPSLRDPRDRPSLLGRVVPIMGRTLFPRAYRELLAMSPTHHRQPDQLDDRALHRPTNGPHRHRTRRLPRPHPRRHRRLPARPDHRHPVPARRPRHQQLTRTHRPLADAVAAADREPAYAQAAVGSNLSGATATDDCQSAAVAGIEVASLPLSRQKQQPRSAVGVSWAAPGPARPSCVAWPLGRSPR